METYSFASLDRDNRSFEQVREIRLMTERFCKAVRDRRLEEIMEFYAEDVRGMDLMPPLSYEGKADYARSWQSFCEAFEEISVYEMDQLKIEAGGSIGFFSGFVHMKGRMNGGETEEYWIQYSAGLGNTSGQWQIHFDHSSLPYDTASQKAVKDCAPKTLLTGLTPLPH